MSYKIAVATSDGEIVDTHFGHAGSFLILEVDEETGAFEEVEERNVYAACGGQPNPSEDGLGCSSEAMEAVAKELDDVEFVLCARSGPKAERVLTRHQIAILDVIMPINHAVKKINQYRDRYKDRLHRI